MRLLTRLFILILLGSTLAYFAPWLDKARAQRDNDAQKLELAKNATSSIVYALNAKQWLTFELDPSNTQSKIVSNATIANIAYAKQEHDKNPLKHWKYAILIEVLDKNNRVIFKKEQHYRTDVTIYKDKKEQLYTNTFYLQKQRVPLDGAVSVFNFTDLKSANKFRLKLMSKDSDIQDVVVRMYNPKKIPRHKIKYLWKRLNKKTKDAMLESSLYPLELLTENEKIALLINTWQVTGPVGQEGVDYTPYTIYILKEDMGEALVDTIATSVGQIISNDADAVIPLPEAGGSFKLHFEPIAEPIAGADIKPRTQNGTITINWYGETAFQRQQFTVPWLGIAQDYTLKLGGGMLVVSANTPLAVRTYQADVSQSGENKAASLSDTAQEVMQEITPVPQYLRTFVSQIPVTPPAPNESRGGVIYAIAHAENTPTPLKVEFRYEQVPPPNVLPPTISYAFLNSDNQVIKAGTIRLNALPSRLDSLSNPYAKGRLSDVTTNYFIAPFHATSLRLVASDTPILVSVYSRPYTLRHTTRAPEDQFDFDAQSKRMNTWFILQPQNSEQLLLNNLSTLITVQPRPPKDKPALQIGNYVWEDFHPTGRWLGRFLFTPQQAGVPFREDALPSAYQEILPNKTNVITIASYGGLQTIKPSLAWVRSQASPAEFKILIDGNLYQKGMINGHSGEITLPAILLGKHQLRVETNAGGRLFINHIKTKGKIYIKRLANIVNQNEKAMQVAIPRTTLDEETISVTLYQPAKSAVRSQLHVDIKGPSQPQLVPLNAWVLNSRVFDVRPESEAALVAFSTQDGSSDIGQSFYIQLPQGTPKGVYQFSVRLAKGAGRYVSFSRLTPGVIATRQILHEDTVMTYEINES